MTQIASGEGVPLHVSGDVPHFDLFLPERFSCNGHAWNGELTVNYDVRPAPAKVSLDIAIGDGAIDIQRTDGRQLRILDGHAAWADVIDPPMERIVFSKPSEGDVWVAAQPELVVVRLSAFVVFASKVAWAIGWHQKIPFPNASRQSETAKST